MRLLTLARRLASLCAAVAILFGSPVTHAQDTPQGPMTAEQFSDAFVGQINRQFSDDSSLDAIVRQGYGKLPPEKAALMKAQLRKTMLHPKLAGYIAHQVRPLIDADLPVNQIGAAVQMSIAKLQMRGMRRLPEDRQALLVNHLGEMLASLPPAVCKAFSQRQLSNAQSMMVEKNYAAALPLPRYQAMADLYVEATVAELDATTPVRSITTEQSDAAQAAHQQAIQARLAKTFDAPALGRIARSLSDAPDEEACAYYAANFLAADDLKEPQRSWQLMRFVQGFQ